MPTATDYGPATRSYVDAIHRQGKVFITQLPATTNLGTAVVGMAGARTANTATTRSTYEVAPTVVQKEMGVLSNLLDQDIYDASHPIQATIRETGKVLDSALTDTLEKTGLDHGLLGAMAKALGIPLSVLATVMAVGGGLVLYSVLRQYRVVPPIREVIGK